MPTPPPDTAAMPLTILNLADLTPCPNALAALNPFGVIASSHPPTRAALLAGLATADAYVATLHTRLDREALAHAPRLRVVATPSTGLDHIDLDACAERGIAILSLRGETALLDSITSTAELTWALLLAVARRLPAAHAAARQGDWARDRLRGIELAGKTLGILGYGRLGRIVAGYGVAFRMRVLVHDTRVVTPPSPVAAVGLDELLRESDVLSLHLHLDDANRHLVNAPMLARLKPGAILLNTSRGGILDEDALLAALASGHLAGAGLDVIDGEWRTDLANHPVVRYAAQHDHLVLTPHLGGVTVEAQARTLTFIADKLAAWLQANPIRTSGSL